MKAFVTFLLCSSVLAAKAEDQIRMVSHGTNVTERPSAGLATNVVKLVKSCLYPNHFPVKTETWQEFEHSDSFVLVTFSAPSKVKVTLADTYFEEGKIKLKPLGEKIVDQILVPLPEGGAGPAQVFAKSGTNVFAFSKWNPKILGMIGSEPALHLSGHLYMVLAHIGEPMCFTNELVAYTNGLTVSAALETPGADKKAQVAALINARVLFHGNRNSRRGTNADLGVSRGILLRVELDPYQDVQPKGGFWRAEVVGTLKSVDFEKREIHIKSRPNEWKAYMVQ